MAHIISQEESGTPSTPSTGQWKLYFKAGGLYILDDAGNETLLATGGVSDGDKGDITVSAGGTVWTIDNGVISLAKMADMATASLLGRNTAGTGAPEVLSAATVRTLLGLVIGTNVQAYDTELAALAGLTSAADKFPYFTGSGTADLLTIVTAIRTLLASADVATFRTNAGLGTGDTPQFTGIEVGHATDTTLARNAAGVLQVEGVIIPSISSTNTLTNKRITPRVGSTTSSATPTINTDNVDFYHLTAQAADITSFTTNLSGTPTDNQKLWIAVTGTAARAITWGTSFEAGAVALPTTTTTTQRLDVGFVWNAVSNKWRCMASGSA